MQQIQQHKQYMLFNFERPLPQQQCFFEPDYWQQQSRISGAAQGRGTTYFLHTADLFGVNCALRHYYRGGFIGKINRDHYPFSKLDNCRSFAEFRLLQALWQAGLNVPKPIGARVIKSSPYCYRADILTEKIENAQDLSSLLQQASLPAQQWQRIGQLIAQLHKQQICHTDLNIHNILCQQHSNQMKFWLIDFDKCYQRRGQHWQKKNLQRLYRSFNKEVQRLHIQFTKENWQALLAGYASLPV